ncbi:MAG: hypothetical protein ACYSSI_05935 [Planctomycetota bacterium]|jgi:hypothetical protein
MIVTATLLLTSVLAYAQKKLFEFGSHGPEFSYDNIRQQIIKWFRTSKLPMQEDQIQSTEEDIAIDSRLYHLKVMGNADKIVGKNDTYLEYKENIEVYCNMVHFEITNYPTELFYGIHFEFNSTELNQALCEAAKEMLAIERQYPILLADIELPKRPSWIFLTRRVLLEDDFHRELPKIATHSRHFVELVGHTFELIYSKEMIGKYLQVLQELKLK